MHLRMGRRWVRARVCVIMGECVWVCVSMKVLACTFHRRDGARVCAC